MTALVFDCDGVLAESERDGHLVAFNRAFEEFDLPVRWSEEVYGEKLLVSGGKERLTVSSFTHREDFAEAALVVSSLGDPDEPMTILANHSPATPESHVTLGDLEVVLGKTAAVG